MSTLKIISTHLLVFAALIILSARAEAADAVEKAEWNGYEMLKFKVAGRSALLVVPKTPAAGKPWIWRTEFFGHAPQADIALLGKGLHVAYIDIGGLFGAPVALQAMDKYYAHVCENYGLSPKVVLEGFSRGGLYAFNWAAGNPQQVACLYVDAPVCDFKSWPGGQGRARHAGREWRQMLSAYKMTDQQANAYQFNPVDNLAPLAKAKIPILSVIGDRHDWVVPIEENTLKVEKRYKALGGEIKVILKPKCGHHPHSLKDPAPIVEFVLQHTSGEEKEPQEEPAQATKEAAQATKEEAPPVLTSKNDPTKPVPGGVRWFGRQHNEYVQLTKNKKFDLCLLGDSITDGWPENLFDRYFDRWTAVNFGIGGDRCENVLWRLENGELVGTSPKVIILLIGTNNSGMNTAPEIAYGIKTVVKALRAGCPKSKILLLGVFPKKDMKLEKTRTINTIIAKLDDKKMVRYLDIGPELLDENDKIKEGMLKDVVHLTKKGYIVWGETMAPLLTEMMEQQ
jgi:lysophospholipase L1-like esterase